MNERWRNRKDKCEYLRPRNFFCVFERQLRAPCPDTQIPGREDRLFTPRKCPVGYAEDKGYAKMAAIGSPDLWRLRVPAVRRGVGTRKVKRLRRKDR